MSWIGIMKNAQTVIKAPEGGQRHSISKGGVGVPSLSRGDGAQELASPEGTASVTEGMAGGQGSLLTVGVSCRAQSFSWNGEVKGFWCWILGLQVQGCCRTVFWCLCMLCV